jgi:hypothetical protein
LYVNASRSAALSCSLRRAASASLARSKAASTSIESLDLEAPCCASAVRRSAREANSPATTAATTKVLNATQS